ncbi:MAG: radical SAM protein [Methanomicrobiales archaeon]
MTSEAVILDGYVDEPTCLGVPPYISPYIRAVAGVLALHGYSCRYVTIDQVRNTPSLLRDVNGSALAVVIAGCTVPGTYLGGTPATLGEIEQIGYALTRAPAVVGGPMIVGWSPGGGQMGTTRAIAGYEASLAGNPAAALDAWLDGRPPVGETDYSRLDRWWAAGAAIIRAHPSFPRVMVELETACGCHRFDEGGCSFCTERFSGPPRYRGVDGIAGEVAALAASGAAYFRLGRQPDLLAYGTGRKPFPRPRPDALEALFSAVREAAPGLRVLHIDNVNPGTIARHEEASREALEVIVAGHTPGDVAAMGVETADPAVVAANNLKVDPDGAERAVEITNEVGARRRDGIPDLLPGLNFVCGLAGETAETFDANEAFLQRILDRGLLVRRVNIRQVMPFAGTPAFDSHTLSAHPSRFRRFREWVRQSFDAPMLRRVFPPGTILRELAVEQEGATLSFGRQLGSYPILAGVPCRVPAGRVIDGVVVDTGERSVTVLPYPVPVNRLPPGALRWLPGVGRMRSATIAAKRPFRDLAGFRDAAGEIPLEWALSFTFP